MGDQLSSNAGSMAQWILTRHGTSMRQVLEFWKVSTFLLVLLAVVIIVLQGSESHLLENLSNSLLSIVIFITK